MFFTLGITCLIHTIAPTSHSRDNHNSVMSIGNVLSCYSTGKALLAYVDLTIVQSYFTYLEAVSGRLLLSGCSQIVTLTWLSSLRVAGQIILTNNQNLVDARLPALQAGVRLLFTHFSLIIF